MTATLSLPIQGKVVLTGASGFIGSRLRDALLASGADVVSLVRADSPPAKRGRSAPIDYCQVSSIARVLAAEKPDYVFHVAGATKGVTYQDFQRGNVQPTENLVRALEQAHPGVKRLLFVSSLTVYGPSNDGPPVRETDPRNPVEHYGRSKLAAERVVEQSAVPWTIIRPAGVYGPGDVDTLVLFQAAKSRINLFYGNRDKRASMVYVDDLVDALVSAAQAESTLGKGYFICDGRPYTWQEIQDHIARAVGKRGLTVNLPSLTVKVAAVAGELLTSIDKKPRITNRQKALMDAQKAWLCSHDAATRDFGFSPRVNMAEGTRRAYDWYVRERWL